MTAFTHAPRCHQSPPRFARPFGEVSARGKDHPHAVRITARAWSYVIWRCWHKGVAYDPGKHHALQAILARHGTRAAHRASQEDQ